MDQEASKLDIKKLASGLDLKQDISGNAGSKLSLEGRIANKKGKLTGMNGSITAKFSIDEFNKSKDKFLK